SGTVTFSGVSDFTGTTKLSGGLLTLNGANRLSSATSLDLAGGSLKLAASGANGQTFQSFSLEAPGTIDLDPSSLTFLDLGTVDSGDLLQIINFDGIASPDYAVRFLGDLTSDPDFLTLIGETTINGNPALYHFDGTYTDVVPEPSTFGFGLALAGMLGYLR